MKIDLRFIIDAWVRMDAGEIISACFGIGVICAFSFGLLGLGGPS